MCTDGGRCLRVSDGDRSRGVRVDAPACDQDRDAARRRRLSRAGERYRLARTGPARRLRSAARHANRACRGGRRPRGGAARSRRRAGARVRRTEDDLRVSHRSRVRADPRFRRRRVGSERGDNSTPARADPLRLRRLGSVSAAGGSRAPKAADRTLPRDAVRATPLLSIRSKLLYASDAARTPELYYLAAKWWREALATVLAQALPPDEAEVAGRQILRENAAALYRV